MFSSVLLLQGSDLLDGSHVEGASKGNIEGSGVAGQGQGTVLQDLREKYLEQKAALQGDTWNRDLYAADFDTRLGELY